ncbi:MAG: SulP family inorganic anion transporter [Anaerolineales bacterium]
MLNIEESSTGIEKFIPALAWLRRYPRSWLRPDIVAGLVSSAVVIPQAMAYATLAGLPVEVGLYTALVAIPVYAFLGTSRPLSVSVTSTIAILTATTLASVVQSSNPYAYILPAATLAFIVGGLLLIAAVLRLGFIANFISAPVLTGFKAGIGLVIFIGQLGKLLGISVDKSGPFETLLNLVRNLNQLSLATVIFSAITLAILLLLPRTKIRLPSPLIAVAFGVVISWLIDLQALGVALVDPIPAGLPSFALPNLSLFSELWTGALGIALISFVESAAAARTFTHRKDSPVRANQELLALSVANFASGFLQGMPAGGGTSQTAVNEDSGARSQIATLATAGVVLLTLLFLAPMVSLMPEATLGALVLVAAIGLMDIAEFRTLRRLPGDEFWWAVIAFAGVAFIGTLEGIVIAIIVTLVDLIRHASDPPIYEVGRKPGTSVYRSLADHPSDETIDGMLILRSEGLIFFGNASALRQKIRAIAERERPTTLVLELSAVPAIEYSGLKELTGLEEELRESGISLWLTTLNSTVFELIEQAPLGTTMGHERMFFNLASAVEHFEKTHDAIPD